jgi:hypothetical protein
LKVLSANQVDMAIDTVKRTATDRELFEYLTSEAEIKNNNERIAFVKGYYACIEISEGFINSLRKKQCEENE